MKISIIIPVYNVEKYVGRCISSIMNQTCTSEVECIIIDDRTPDRSMAIVEKMVANYTGPIIFRIIYNEQNQGIAAVRNTGLKAAKGDYILYFDSDDYCEPDMLEKMYGKAIAEDADIVVSDYWETYKDKEIYYKQFVPESRVEALKSLLIGNLKGYSCNKLYRRKLFIENGIEYKEGINFGEDQLVAVYLFFYAKRIVHVPFAFLHYVQYNSESLSHSVTKKTLDNLIYIETCIIDFLQKKEVDKIYEAEIIMIQLVYWKVVLFYTLGKLQKEMNTRYCHITPGMVIKYSSVIGKYWSVALLFASLKMLFLFNLMRSFWGVMRFSVYREMSFCDNTDEE